MADVAKMMYQGQPATTDDAIRYSSPAAGAIVRAIHICNTTGTARSVTISLSAAGDVAMAAANHFLSAVPIPANSTYDWSGFQALGGPATVGTIRALQENATACTVRISGVEI